MKNKIKLLLLAWIMFVSILFFTFFKMWFMANLIILNNWEIDKNSISNDFYLDDDYSNWIKIYNKWNPISFINWKRLKF